LGFAIMGAAAQGSDLRFRHYCAFDKVANQPFVYRIGDVIERWALREVLIRIDALNLNTERFLNVAYLPVRFWVLHRVGDQLRSCRWR
jgi:hypothetical protein